MSDQVDNLITFTPVDDSGDSIEPIEDARVFLKLESPFVRRVGLEPNVNAAVMPWSEWEKIKDHVRKSGKIEFWATSKPPPPNSVGERGNAKPDCVLHDQRIVNFMVSRHGDAFGRPPKSPIEYRVFFADFRERLKSPRGGRVSDGLINDQRLSTPPLVFRQNAELMDRCLDKMGISFESTPTSVNAVQPPLNLKWFGNHAPTELARLLDRALAVFTPLANGSGKIDVIGTGDVPSFDENLIAEDRPDGGVDRRGDIVVFSSAPQPVQETIRITHWKWVIHDATATAWVDASSYINEFDVRVDFAAVPAVRRDTIRTEAFRCILLDFAAQTSLNGMSANTPTLRKLIDDTTNSGKVSDIRVWASMAVQAADGTWSNSEAPVEIIPERMIDTPRGPVLVLPRMIGNVELPRSASLTDNFLVLPETTVSPGGSERIFLYVEATVEPLRKVPGTGVGGVAPEYRPEFFNVGFKRVGANILPLSADEVANALDSPGRDTLIISRPELRLIRIFGNEINRAELSDKAKALAPRYLATTPTGRSLTVKGFQQEELSGRVVEISYDQERVTTTFTIDTWFTPLAGKIDVKLLEGKEFFQGQHETAAIKLYEGGGGAGQQPAVPIGIAPSTAPQRPGTSLMVRDDGDIVTSTTSAFLFWNDHFGRNDWTLTNIGGTEVQIEWRGIYVVGCDGVGYNEMRGVEFGPGFQLLNGTVENLAPKVTFPIEGDSRATGTASSYDGGIRIDQTRDVFHLGDPTGGSPSCTDPKVVHWNGQTFLYNSANLSGKTFAWKAVNIIDPLKVEADGASQVKITLRGIKTFANGTVQGGGDGWNTLGINFSTGLTVSHAAGVTMVSASTGNTFTIGSATYQVPQMTTSSTWAWQLLRLG